MNKENREFMTKERRDMIHNHRKKADLYGPEQPFQFGIFKSKTSSLKAEIYFKCNSCGKMEVLEVRKNTYAVPCECGGLYIKQE